MTKHYGKLISSFLIDDDPCGRWTCEIFNWSGKAYKIPRTMLNDCADRKELSQAGVYFLFGRDDETGNLLVYIGEAEKIMPRLRKHLKEKDFWNEVILFIHDKLNKAHVKYLENRLYELAVHAKRYKNENKNVPPKPSLSEPELASLEEFIDNVLILVRVLGHHVFESVVPKSANSAQQIHYFLKQEKGNVNAEGMQTPDGFVVLAGATINKNPVKSLCKGTILLREKYQKEKRFKNYRTTEDILFSSSSSAAKFLTGNSKSGPISWKTSEGKSLKDIETEKTTHKQNGD